MLLPQIPDLNSELWRLVSQIPPGCVTTYGDIAKTLGDVSASRFVGSELLHHEHTAGCMCHRVVRADGSLGKFVSGDVEEKANLLRCEGVAVEAAKSGLETFEWKVVDDERWREFDCTRPLDTLAEFQRSLANEIDVSRPLDTSVDELDIVAGVDVSFVPNSNLAVAAYVEVSLSEKQPVYEKTYRTEIPFPYISGYLAFRELPLLLELLNLVRPEKTLADIILVDGSGVLHPRGTGVASMLGVVADVPTLGVTKKHLVGDVGLDGLAGDSFREIHVDQRLCGFAMLPGSGTNKPIYISPGHRCDAVSSLAMVQRCRLGRRLPEPIYWADRISRQFATKKA